VFQVTANSWESGLFILFLVFFAIIAAGYVLKKVNKPLFTWKNLLLVRKKRV